MTRILQPGLIALLLALGSACGGRQPSFTFGEMAPPSMEAHYPFFEDYCHIGPNGNPEIDAVTSAFAGDYQQALHYAALDERYDQAIQPLEGLTVASNDDLQEVEARLVAVINDPNTPEEQLETVRKFLHTMKQAQKGAERWVFGRAEMHTARDYILSLADDYHFTLINEAHYNSENRVFTKSLLKPLWEIGYRYLALEAFGYNVAHNELPYPHTEGGYYFKDTNFGNLIREAKGLGYQLIIYEDTSGRDGEYRDSIQALNIYRQTLANDTVGKVLVHAGYGHIFENLNAMGDALKRKAGMDILTIDQQLMTYLPDSTLWHPWYKYVHDTFKPKEAVVFTDSTGEPIREPVTGTGIDVQVYHPPVTYKNGRPAWLYEAGKEAVEIPADWVTAYKGHLLMATPAGEGAAAVPLDQIVIGRANTLLLPPGNYTLRLADCTGALAGETTLTVQ